MKKGNGQFFQTAAILLVVGLAVWFAFYSAHPQRAWIITMILLYVLCLLLGYWIMAIPEGLLINDRNLMSLSRLQIVLWTLVIFSGYIVVAMLRILYHVQDPLLITIDANLWAVRGISTASFLGTPVILNNKTQDDPSADALRTASLALIRLRLMTRC